LLVVLCVITVVPRTIPESESLILSVILALLPMSSLFLVNGSSICPNQQVMASRSVTGDCYASRERLPESGQPSNKYPTDSVHVFAELDSTNMRSSSVDSKITLRRGLHQGAFERELQAIDRM